MLQELGVVLSDNQEDAADIAAEIHHCLRCMPVAVDEIVVGAAAEG